MEMRSRRTKLKRKARRKEHLRRSRSTEGWVRRLRWQGSTSQEGEARPHLRPKLPMLLELLLAVTNFSLARPQSLRLSHLLFLSPKNLCACELQYSVKPSHFPRCKGCQLTNCGRCVFCLDMPAFGGNGKKKQRCELRVCEVSCLAIMSHSCVEKKYFFKLLNSERRSVQIQGDCEWTGREYIQLFYYSSFHCTQFEVGDLVMASFGSRSQTPAKIVSITRGRGGHWR